MHLKIITQEKVVFDSEVDEIYSRGVDGILQFENDNCLILTTLAEPGDEIDEMRAKEALERSRHKLNEAHSRMESKRIEASIARAKARLKAKLNEGN